MPAVKRRLFNVLAAVSLVLGAAVVWLAMPRGHVVHHFFHRSADGRYQLLQFYPGEVSVGISNNTSFDPPAPLGDDSPEPVPPPPVSWGHRGGGIFSGYWPVRSVWNW